MYRKILTRDQMSKSLISMLKNGMLIEDILRRRTFDRSTLNVSWVFLGDKIVFNSSTLYHENLAYYRDNDFFTDPTKRKKHIKMLRNLTKSPENHEHISEMSDRHLAYTISELFYPISMKSTLTDTQLTKLKDLHTHLLLTTEFQEEVNLFKEVLNGGTNELLSKKYNNPVRYLSAMRSKKVHVLRALINNGWDVSENEYEMLQEVYPESKAIIDSYRNRKGALNG